jgi:hypothetical protein
MRPSSFSSLLPKGDDAACIRALKEHLLAGRSFSELFAPLQRSLFEGVADSMRVRALGLPVIEFMLANGAPIVLVDARQLAHDGFMAIATCLPTGPAVRVAILRRFIDVGYKPSRANLLDALSHARSDEPLHSFLLSRIEFDSSRDPIVVSPMFFEQLGSDCALVLRELNVVPFAGNEHAFQFLFQRLLQNDNIWFLSAASARELLARVYRQLPSAHADFRHGLLNQTRFISAALAVIVPLLEPFDRSDQTFSRALLAAAVRHQSTIDFDLLACVFERTGLDVNEMVDGDVPVLSVVASQLSTPLAVLEFLLAKGADPNKRSLDGRTPLHYSCSVRVDEALVAAGADSSLRDSLGQTPFDIARHADDIERCFYLQTKDRHFQPVLLRELEPLADAPASVPPRAALDAEEIARLVALGYTSSSPEAVTTLVDMLRVGTLRDVETILDNGALGLLMGNSTSNDAVTVAQALDALASIASRSVELRDRVLGAGAAIQLVGAHGRHVNNAQVVQSVSNLASALLAGSPSIDAIHARLIKTELAKIHPK